MTAARLAARCLALLGPVEGPLAVHAPARPRLAAALTTAAAAGNGQPAAAVVAFVGTDADAATRRALLADVRQRLPSGARLVVVDHNQPRRLGPRLLAALALAVRGRPLARARYPAAQEVAAAGFQVDALRLAAGERIQLVLAHRRAG